MSYYHFPYSVLDEIDKTNESWDKMHRERMNLHEESGRTIKKYMGPACVASLTISIGALVIPTSWGYHYNYFAFFYCYFLCMPIIFYSIYRQYKINKRIKTWERKNELWKILHGYGKATHGFYGLIKDGQ